MRYAIVVEKTAARGQVLPFACTPVESNDETRPAIPNLAMHDLNKANPPG